MSPSVRMPTRAPFASITGSPSTLFSSIRRAAFSIGMSGETVQGFFVMMSPSFSLSRT
jgi:hypothetical protein